MNIIHAAIILSFLLSFAAPAAAQVTTLDQQLSIWDGLFRSAQADPGSVDLRAALPSYGFYCGTQPAPPVAATPFDCVDAACLAHDLSPGYTTPRPTLEQVRQSDRQFIGSLAVTQASTPYGELYRNAAMQIFEAKTVFEQANRSLVFTGCADCQAP